jgi:hypothetical protein
VVHRDGDLGRVPRIPRRGQRGQVLDQQVAIRVVGADLFMIDDILAVNNDRKEEVFTASAFRGILAVEEDIPEGGIRTSNRLLKKSGLDAVSRT